jgi:hypothetical protein
MLTDGRALTSRGNISQVSYSTDFGNTWVSIPGPNITQQFIAKAAWLKSRDDFFVGGGNFFASDGLYRFQTGMGWSHNAAVGNVQFIEFAYNNTGILTNVNNLAFKTVDGGTTWTQMNYNGGNHDRIQMVDANTYFIGDRVSYDGGVTFQFNTHPSTILSFRYFTPTYALGMTSNGDVYKTTDSGLTWQLQLDPTNIPIPNFYITEETIYSFGSNSDIYTLDVSSFLNASDVTGTTDYIKIYPNPFVDVVTLDNNEQTVSKVAVCDLSSKLIREVKISTATTDINLAEMPSGIYFMHVYEGDKLVTMHKLIKE